MKNLLAYTPETFDNLELESEAFEYESLAGEMDMEEGEAARRRRAGGRAPRRFSPAMRKPRLIKPQVRPRFPFVPPRIGAAASVNVFPPADDRRPSGQSSSSGSAGGEGSFANAPAQDLSSEHVRWVQETLNRALGLRLIVDGIMNKETRSAVRMFQERKGLPVTGLVGPDTEEALRTEGGQAAAEPELLEGEWEMEEAGFFFEDESIEGAEFEDEELNVESGEFDEVEQENKAASLHKLNAPRLIKSEMLPEQQTLYVEIDLGIRDNAGHRLAESMTGIFIPQGCGADSSVDIILYLHGYTYRFGQLTIADYWNRNRFSFRPLREELNRSRKNVILVAPTLGPKSQTGFLTRPGGLDAFIDQILIALRSYGPHRNLSAQPTIGNLILACHSGGGLPMRKLALSRNRCTAAIRECWGFDCTYNREDDTAWADWAKSKPNSRVFIYYIPKTRTQILSAKLQQMNVPNAVVQASSAKRHELVPVTHWAERLRGAAFLRDIGAESNEAEWEMRAFRLVPVENPGGGRIRDKRAPASSDLVTVTGAGGKGISLHRLAAQAWQVLVNAARADGIKHPLLLPVSGYRSPATQAGKWKKALEKYDSPEEARKWVAPPGHSAHQSGRAIDCYLGGSISSSNVNALRKTSAYKWLTANAARFGFYPYDREPWHWEYNPPAATQHQIQQEIFESMELPNEFFETEEFDEIEFESSGGSDQAPNRLGLLVFQRNGKQVFQYQFTPNDLLWTARLISGEAGAKDDLENRAVIAAMLNRFALFTHRVYPTFSRFLQAYSTPLQPVLLNKNVAQHYMNDRRFVKLGGTYKGTNIPLGQLNNHLNLQKTPWERLSPLARKIALEALTGQMPDTGIGLASEFASTWMLYGRHVGKENRTESGWLGYTKRFKNDKGWRWIGAKPNFNQKRNAFFVDPRAVNLSPNSIKVVPPEREILLSGEFSPLIASEEFAA